MEEVKNLIHPVFSRHIARALGAMEIGGASQEMKSAVKAEFWYLHDDIISALESKLKEVENGK